MDLDTTIVAISSPRGDSSRALLRATGKTLFSSLRGLGCACTPRRAAACVLQLPCGKLPVLAFAYPAASSFCGQDTIEIELPNNANLLQIVLQTLISATGGRHAEAGEFTARAFFLGKLSLSEAEGVCATISANNDSELQGATLLREGALHARVLPVSESICKTLALVESGIDFVDEEDVVAISQSKIEESIQEASQALQAIVMGNIAMATLRNLPTVVLAGKPNAGKSTLFNALLQRSRVVVSSAPGTTRDAIKEPVWFGSKEAMLIDIAGLDVAHDPLNASAQKITNRTIEDADVVLWCVAPRDDAPALGKNGILVYTKADTVDSQRTNAVSAHTRHGMKALQIEIESMLTAVPTPTSDALALYPRHIQYVEDAIEALARAKEIVHVPELVATSLREVLNSVGKITGDITPDEVLGEVFSSFCIGK